MSEKSNPESGDAIEQAYRRVLDLGYHLQDPWNLSNEHITALRRRWGQSDLSVITVQGRLVALSWWGPVLRVRLAARLRSRRADWARSTRVIV
ncbi:MAG: hypothetical protein JSS05_09405 [Proteobacteria bacterium]|nr:hypothetical protein [Pseudomonadota bacterium]